MRLSLLALIPVVLVCASGPGPAEPDGTVGSGASPTHKSVTAIRGVASPEAVVSLRDEFGALTVLKAGADGSYVFDGVRLKEGRNRLVLRLFDEKGNASESIREVLCDTVPPALSVLAPKEGLLARGPSVEIRGTTEAHATVLVKDGALECGAATAGADGAFRILPPKLPDGRHELAIVARDAAGNEATVTRRFAVDGTPPAVRIVSPATGMLTYRNRLGVRHGRRHPVSINVVVESEPHASVELLVNNEGRGSAVAAADGKVRFVGVGVPITQIWLGAAATDSAGNVAHAPRVWLGQPKF